MRLIFGLLLLGILSLAHDAGEPDNALAQEQEPAGHPYAYIADREHGLHIVDVSNPQQPVEVGSYYTPSPARALVLAGERIYLAEGDTMQVLDASDPEEPTRLSYYRTYWPIESVETAGFTLYLGHGNYGLSTLRFTNVELEDMFLPAVAVP